MLKGRELVELGLHFRLDDEQVAPVLEAVGDDARLWSVLSAYEEDEAVYARACETDKAWDPIACALAPAAEEGPWPARGVIGGARALQADDDESWITHLDLLEVADVAGYLRELDDLEFSRLYAEMPEELRNPEYGPDEERYALTWLTALRQFFAAADDERAHVVFTVNL